ncbi:MAG TPA: lysophospholipid acyltransferase family protein [Pseudogracilibacillus sp.]|nr:lysophospholipid acyltransferase family protein [Pseudogracilibacillus sp.]
MYGFARHLVKMILSLFGFLKIYDKDKLPEDEGYVLACTHTGWVDILWLGIAVYPTHVHYMAKKELFKTKFLNWLMTGLNAFPVDRDNPGPSSIKTPMKLIKEDKVVGIFPSGTRTSDDVPLKRGAVTIAMYSKSPIVPAAYVGPNNFKELFLRKKPRIIFGDPLYLNKELSRKEALEELAARLDDAMYNLQQELMKK